MAVPTITATAGHASANSYILLADANTYHDAHVYAATWTAAPDATRIRALIWSTRLIDKAYDFVGVIAGDTQALRWPRVNAYDRDGRLLANDEIPTELEQATAELARHLIDADRTAPESTDLATKRVKAGSIEVEFLNGSTTAADTIPAAAFDLIRHLVVNQSKYGAVTVRRA